MNVFLPFIVCVLIVSTKILTLAPVPPFATGKVPVTPGVTFALPLKDAVDVDGSVRVDGGNISVNGEVEIGGSSNAESITIGSVSLGNASNPDGSSGITSYRAYRFLVRSGLAYRGIK
mgnify:CR=1 FL=1